MTGARQHVAARIRATTIGLLLAMLSACGDDAPPPDFEAVPPAAARGPGDQCPDLIGTFALAGTPLAAEILERKPPFAHDLPLVVSFAQGPTHVEAWWVVPRAAFFRYAREMRKDSPDRYTRWRWLVTKEHVSQDLQHDFDAYLAAVAALGPPAPVYAGIVSRGCADHWMLARNETRTMPPRDGSNERAQSVEREIWLARDRLGALLVKTVTYQLYQYSIWAPSTQYLRTSSHAEYARIPQLDLELPVGPTTADLPPDPRTDARVPMTCAEAPARVATFSQRLAQLLPRGTELARFDVEPKHGGGEEYCRFVVVQLAIATKAGAVPARTVDWLRKEPDVRSVEILPLLAGERHDSMQRLRVVLH